MNSFLPQDWLTMENLRELESDSVLRATFGCDWFWCRTGWIPPSRDSSPTLREEGSLALCRKEFKSQPELEKNKKFTREGIMLHRQSMVFSQSQRMSPWVFENWVYICFLVSVKNYWLGNKEWNEWLGLFLTCVRYSLKSLFSCFPFMVWV